VNNVTFVGNLVSAPELRFSADGKPRATFTVAVSEGQGEEEKTHFVNATAFGTLGENIAQSLDKGTRVVVVGRINTYKKAVILDGDEKQLTMVGFTASAVGPDLRWATATVAKVARGTSNGATEPTSGARTEAPKATAGATAHANGGDDF